MVIKHLVLSGGGPTGFLTYGAARFLSKEGFWDISNIESIYELLVERHSYKRLFDVRRVEQDVAPGEVSPIIALFSPPSVLTGTADPCLVYLVLSEIFSY